jgi:hypothetical protein
MEACYFSQISLNSSQLRYNSDLIFQKLYEYMEIYFIFFARDWILMQT